MAHSQEGLFHVHPGRRTRGCCAASADRGASLAACRPEKMSTAGSASGARSSRPYVTFPEVKDDFLEGEQQTRAPADVRLQFQKRIKLANE